MSGRAALVGLLLLSVTALTLGAIFLRDIRVARSRAECRGELVAARTSLTELGKSKCVLEEFVASDEPRSTRLVAIARAQNPEMSPSAFDAWLVSNLADLRKTAEQDVAVLPNVIKQKTRDVEALESKLEQIGHPWLFR
ncbi:MAG: hypothetical protein ACYS9X_12030 [Planctomycetota bacterium]|jgi:hypothetical protein